MDQVSTRGRIIEVVGEVVSNKMNKTISVKIFRMVRHEKYSKYLKKASVFKAHDEKNEAKIGDTVKIHETRPMSKTKRWALSEIIEKAKV
ncbi:MAG: 30S ribosomal protein S17 [Bdellovibrionales bacterium]|jgi:small subunit ribosomal protein S17|nr:30S ribosomal protein S17 [Bdellovibrionales bacterium]